MERNLAEMERKIDQKTAWNTPKRKWFFENLQKTKVWLIG